MSDFLSRVAARAAGTAETIQPRVWSRFETVPDEPSETSFAAAVAPRRDEAQSVPSSAPPQSPPPQSAPPAAPALPQRFVEVDRIVERIVAPQLARRTETPQPPLLPNTPLVPNTPPPIAAIAAPVAPAAAPRAQDVRPSVPGAPVERVIEQTVERIETRPEVDVERIVAYVPVSPVIEPPIVPSAAAATFENERPQVAAHRPQRMEGPRERVVMQPQILPAPLRADRLPPAVRSRTIPPSHSAPSQPPAVHVSIGRVEVRATVAPERTHTPRPSAPPSPLDEYLRRRDKRGR